MISLVISLTTTPMMCAWLLRTDVGRAASRKSASRAVSRAFGARLRRMLRGYERRLDWALAMQAAGDPAAGRGDRAERLPVSSRCPRASSRSRTPASSTAACAPTRASRSRRCRPSCTRSSTSSTRIRRSHTVVGFTGGSRAGGGFMFVNLKPEGAAQGRRPGGDRAAAAAAAPGDGHPPVPQPGAGPAHRRARRATRPTSTRSRATTAPTSKTGRQKLADAMKDEHRR